MIKHLYLYGVLTLLLLVTACQPKTDDMTDPIVNVPVDFRIDIRENLNNLNQDDLRLFIETTNLYDCENVEIDASVSRSSNTFVVQLNDIVEPVDCIPLENDAPAHQSVQLTDIDLGFFPLLIKLKNTIVNTGELKVNNIKYSIEMESLDGIEFVHKELYRIPNNFIWGHISYEGIGGATVADNFFTAALDATSPKSLSTGYYGYFNVDDNEVLSMESAGAYANTETFYYNFEGQDTWLEEMIAAFNQNTANAKVELKIFTSEGQEF